MNLKTGICQRKFYKKQLEDCFFEVNGKSINPNDINIRTFNFGQNWRSNGIVEGKYSVTISNKWVCDYITHEYNELVEFCKNDFAEDEEPEEISVEFKKFSYPPSMDFLLADSKSYKSLILQIIRWFEYELLSWWLGNIDNPEEIPKYAMNTIDNIELLNKSVLFQGICRIGIPNGFKLQDA